MSYHTPPFNDFTLSSYDYPLPQSAIAQNPANPRESAKLLVYERESGRITHSDFYHFCDFVPKETLIVLNNTKVIKARIYAHKLNPLTQSLSHKKYEIFFHKALETTNSAESTLFLAQIKGRVKKGDKLIIADSTPLALSSQAFTLPPHSTNTPIVAEVKECLENGLRIVSFKQENHLFSYEDMLTMLSTYGHIPLPPYIKRSDSQDDALFYQSVFGTSLGSIAAPTASLHFSEKSIESLREAFELCFITLHIGAGTFMNVESSDIRHHHIHTESYELSAKSAKAIEKANKVLCIGTTSARCVEHYMRHKILKGECDIFLYPSVDFKRVDYLLTNFHLPKSTLLMLVSAMIGRKKCLELYEIALNQGYRFYSYGDGMLIL